MELIERLVTYFKQPEEETKNKAPKGVCPACWGRQEYGHK